MQRRLEFVQSISQDSARRLAYRQAALWIGPDFGEHPDVGLLSDIVGLPWAVVLCECSAASVAKAIDAPAEGLALEFERVRGFIHVIASDPEELTLPPRALPVYFLNGRDDAIDPAESSKRSSMGQQRRLLNMMNALRSAQPVEVVVLCNVADQPLQHLRALWDDGLRTLVTVISISDTPPSCINDWLVSGSAPSVIDFWHSDLQRIRRILLDSVRNVMPDQRVRIEVGVAESRALVDITESELPEQPVLDRYDIIVARDLPPISPDQLSIEEFVNFFDKSKDSWLPYAAGLPWLRSLEPTTKTLKALRRVSKRGAADNRILFIASESGAGGTTLARSIAFSAARDGFPTLVARSIKFHPDATEISGFLFRANRRILEGISQALTSDGIEVNEHADTQKEPAWLLVFDVQHWDGREAELRAFVSELTRSGRSVVIVMVTGPDIHPDLAASSRSEKIAVVGHELSRNEAVQLGQHINLFLTPLGKAKPEHQWLQFWNAHTPNIQNRVASFWISLEFWLKGQLDLSESVQSWLYGQFKALAISIELRQLILEIAALTADREPLPEGVMSSVQGEELPLSVILDQLRSKAPGLALVRDLGSTQRQWAMAHDLLGRYLVQSVYFDRAMLQLLGLSDVRDPVDLRLRLLRRVATRKELALRNYLPLALEFAVKILKLDFGGNAEYFRYWREVIAILKDMPAQLRQTSRAFNHHVAISCRRVVKMSEYFDATPAEQRSLLLYAVERLEYAANTLPRTPDDESNVNLLNSLSLAYQDLADWEQVHSGEQNLIRLYRQKAAAAARRALEESPANSYVLETMAKNLLQNGQVRPDERVTSAGEALGYIFQAMSLDQLEARQNQLTQLANRALQMLRSSDSALQIERLVTAENPLGYVAKAWLTLANGIDTLEPHSLNDFPKENVTVALRELNQAPRQHSNWLILRFKYDLTAISEPFEFDTQLNLLDELEGTSYKLPLQLQLERAILLYQRNRHHDANIKFTSLRQDLKNVDVLVHVPRRLEWLLSDNAKAKRLCTAVVVSDVGYRARAKVQDLRNVEVPFIPQEFGKQRLAVRQHFKCFITFGPMGPFIKPPVAG